MKKTVYHLSIICLLIQLLACGTGKEIAQDPEVITIAMDTLEVPILDEKTVEVPYRASFHRKIDLLHTLLRLKFDWEKEQVIGEAVLTIKPKFRPIDSIYLDAKNFKIGRVYDQLSKKDLAFDYDGEKIGIALSKTLTYGQEIKIGIDYVATPVETGGSNAITSNRGLYFINAKGDEDKPQQIWTQGETEANSKWFPTIDKPNERCTQEVYLTVQDKFKTLSNGLLKSSRRLPDGMREDYWVMDQPHAPYLFMLAIGEFEIVKERWRNKELQYYVEPAYKNDAKAIFANTAEMLDFFSQKLDLAYPWQKYAQVVVRDFVSGAMENTTSVIFGDFVQKHKRSLMPPGNDGIVAHELMHHWFGNYVTCESWANLTMNEGFANYAEYLWYEHKYGVDYAERNRDFEKTNYLMESQSGTNHDLIDFHYENRENMFDAHSYNKGGLVLHMLRKYLGDDMFFAALNLFLRKKAYKAVEVHHLRLAFEEISGEDLNWFFNQWYLSSGYPILWVSHNYDDATKKLTVSVTQKQSEMDFDQVFRLPTKIQIVDQTGQVSYKTVVVDELEEKFTFDVEGAPKLVNFDPENTILGVEHEKMTLYQGEDRVKHAQHVLERMNGLKASKDIALIKKELKHPAAHIRNQALRMLYDNKVEGIDRLLDLQFLNDDAVANRVSALRLLTKLKSPLALKRAKEVVSNQLKPYYEVSKALEVIEKLAPKTLGSYSSYFINEPNLSLANQLGSYFVKHKDLSKIGFFHDLMTKAKGPIKDIAKNNLLRLVTENVDLGKTAYLKYFASLPKGASRTTDQFKDLLSLAADPAIKSILDQIVLKRPDLKSLYSQTIKN